MEGQPNQLIIIGIAVTGVTLFIISWFWSKKEDQKIDPTQTTQQTSQKGIHIEKIDTIDPSADVALNEHIANSSNFVNKFRYHFGVAFAGSLVIGLACCLSPMVASSVAYIGSLTKNYIIIPLISFFKSNQGGAKPKSNKKGNSAAPAPAPSELRSAREHLKKICIEEANLMGQIAKRKTAASADCSSSFNDFNYDIENWSSRVIKALIGLPKTKAVAD